MRRWMLCLLALALLGGGAGCAPSGQKDSSDYQLYFLADEEKFGSALDTQPYQGEEPAQIQTMLNALLAGPTQEGLRSPFPRGVSLTEWELDKESGILHLTLSEQYSGLADISLTLADYCIVLTLCQLDGVEGVEIRSAGYSVNYRSHQLLRPEEVELQPPDTKGT